MYNLCGEGRWGGEGWRVRGCKEEYFQV